MKTNAIVRILLYSLAILILSSILLGVICYKTLISDNEAYYSGHEELEAAVESMQMDFAGQQVRNIEIEWVAGSITIHKGKDIDNIHVEEYSSGKTIHRMLCRVSGQTLKIQFSEDSIKRFGPLSNERISKNLVITVPENWKCNAIEIDAAASEVDIHDLIITELDFDCASGTLLLDNCNIKELDIDTASGDVEFTGHLEELSFDAASAKFYGEFLHTPDHLVLNTLSGNLEIILPEDSGFTLDLDTMSGSLDSDFTYGKHEDTYICGDGTCSITVSAMSGDVQILKGVEK